MLKIVNLFFVLLMVLSSQSALATITDDAGQKLNFPTPPTKVVSLVPTATELMSIMGLQEALAGRTYVDLHFEELMDVPIIGGIYTPNFELINAQNPDLLIVSPWGFKAAQEGRGQKTYPILVWDDQGSLINSEAKIAWIGEIFNNKKEADKVRSDNHDLLGTIESKIKKIDQKDRQRVMRLVGGHDQLLTPGEANFQGEIITAAGGVPPKFGPKAFEPVTLEKWVKFNPQVIYGCGNDKKAIEKLTAQPQWAEVDAIKNKRILYFPCAVTDRASAHTGYFAAWLATSLYSDAFGQVAALVHPQEIVTERKIELDMPYVAQARIVDSRMMDFIHRTLLINFKTPQTVVSTADGLREGIEVIGNSYSPPPMWVINHQGGWEESKADRLKVLGLDEKTSSLLFTGADLDNLAVKSVSHQDLTITALVTAGAEGNALRVSRDVGAYYKPGTINIIVLSNRKLSESSATNAIITITEAKTAALWDMDIRSTQTPRVNPATGTGTDSIIVVAGGAGEAVDYTGGHSKVGQLMGEAVYQAVVEALGKQNGKAMQRHIFERLAERGISLYAVLTGPDYPKDYKNFQHDLEALLMSPKYNDFIKAAFSLDDAVTMGQISDPKAYNVWANAVASQLAQKHITELDEIVVGDDLPPLLKTALNALSTGLKQQRENSKQTK